MTVIEKCLTCQRRSPENPFECLVMKEQFEDCWAWTDDPEWETKVEKAVINYEWRWKGVYRSEF